MNHQIMEKNIPEFIPLPTYQGFCISTKRKQSFLVTFWETN